MYRSQFVSAEETRRGMILLVVLFMLTLFAIAGLSLVLYADAELNASRLSRDGAIFPQPDMEPELAFAFFLGQLIYDCPDNENGVYSALRGHSLARSLYGSNDEGSNVAPFNGTGRLHYTHPAASGPAFSGKDDINLINYIFYAADGLRDPERYGPGGTVRANLAAQRNPYTGGFNPPYTYPDLNNMFLAKVMADGRVLLPSFHRPWTGFGSLDPSNPNWDAPDPALKYMVMRPRRGDHSPAFPLPEDAGGDVKNLVGAPGGNDSIWIDVGAPVLMTADGRKYKMLVAPLIMDLDNRININVHGSLKMSNQGWGRWEINPAHVLNADPSEWKNLLLANSVLKGRYGPNGVPGAGSIAFPGNLAPPYSRADLDGMDGAAGTGPLVLPGPAPGGFLVYNNGYGDGDLAERTGHPSVANFLSAAGDDRAFRASLMEARLRYGDTGSPHVVADLQRMCPNNLAPPSSSPQVVFDAARRRRNMVSTHSTSFGRPTLSPWLWDRNTSGYAFAPTETRFIWPPSVAPAAFPLLSTRQTPVPDNSDFNFPNLPVLISASQWSPAVDWRATMANYPRIDLNRFLTPYPHLGQIDPTTGGYVSVPPAATTVGAAPGYANWEKIRFDDGGAIQAQFLRAQQDRQVLADEIYRMLMKVTGVTWPLANKAVPTAQELQTLRWLAQLAVNIVDFIDEDDIRTPFNFYTAADAGVALPVNPTNPNTTEPLPQYWVFGNELPRVVLNEALVEHTALPAAGANGPVTVQAWVELSNPLPAGPYPGVIQQQTGNPVPLHVAAGANAGQIAYAPYRVVIANTNATPGGPLLPAPGGNGNAVGAPDFVRPATITDVEFTASPSVRTVADAAGAGTGFMYVPASGYFLVGPTNQAENDREVDGRASINKTPPVPGTTPWLGSKAMKYVADVTVAADNTQTWNVTIAGNPVPIVDHQSGVTILLRRLANPYMPHNPDPAAGPLYNPYLTIDYMEKVPLNNSDPNGPNQNAVYASRGKKQPYASGIVPPAVPVLATDVDPLLSQVVPQDQPAVAAGPATQHTFGIINSPQPVAPPAGPGYQWLCHLDRRLISPMELLQVSGCQPHQLTHLFITPPDPTSPIAPTGLHAHRVPWFDQGNRLYRIFEFIMTHDMAAGSIVGGRQYGKVNINTMTELEIFQAICDAQASNYFTAADVAAVYAQIVRMRTVDPTGVPGPNDRPFQGMGAGVIPAGGEQFPQGLGILDTFFRPAGRAVVAQPGGSLAPRLFQRFDASTDVENPTDNEPNVHPYLKYQLLNKIYNHMTTQSNIFAVWATVGFFEVVDDTTRPVKLGAEIGRSEGRHVRHRMFAIVDRSNITITGGAPTVDQRPAFSIVATGFDPTTRTVSVTSTRGISESGGPWEIKAGGKAIINAGAADFELVNVLSVAAGGTSFTIDGVGRYDPNGLSVTNIDNTKLGNPGPQLGYDPRKQPWVVRHLSILK